MRKRMIGKAVALLFVLGTVSPASARTIMGEGVASCGAWTETARERREKPFKRTLHETWLLGYLSGVNAAFVETDFLTKADAPAITAWIDNYCQTNPLETIQRASNELIRALQAR